MGSSAVAMKLPPRDPYEPQDPGPPAGASLPAPTAIFLCGPPSPEADRLADAILAFRPARPGFLWGGRRTRGGDRRAAASLASRRGAFFTPSEACPAPGARALAGWCAPGEA